VRQWPTLHLMKRVLTFLAMALCLGTAPLQAQPRPYDQAQLDSMLAPIALHPDGLVSQILIASTYPEEVQLAAGWSRVNSQLRGEDAVRAVQNEPWDPAVKALVAFPELLARMAESPQWLSDLGQAFIGQQAQVMDTVQALRRRAQGTGHLTSNDQQVVYDQGQEIVVQPRTQIVYVPYYDPYVVYGPWWWPYYNPVYWSPWVVRPVYLSYGFFYAKPYWRYHHVHVVNRPVYVAPHQTYVAPGKWTHRSVAAAVGGQARQFQSQPQSQPQVQSQPRSREFQRVPESQRRPISHSAPAQAAPAPTLRQSVRESIHDSPRPQQQRSVQNQPQRPLQAAASSPAIRQQVRESVRDSMRDAPRQAAPRSAPPQSRGIGPQVSAQMMQSHGMPAAGGFSNQRGHGQGVGQAVARGQAQGRGHRQ